MSTKQKDPALSGMLSSAVTVRKVRGQVVVTNRRRQRAEPTAAQLEVQARFLEAAQYASLQVSQDDSKALYASGMTDKKNSAYLVAVIDYLSPPKIKGIDAAAYAGGIGQAIVVKAVDDFMVTRVKLAIIDAAGVVIEQGDAEPNVQNVNQWEYKSTVANPALTGTTIRAIAYDRPGNSATMEKVL